MRSCSIQKFLTGLCAVLMALCLVAPSSAVAAAPGGINTEAALRKLIENAKDGDVLLVDNITFASVSDPVTVDKSITFRSYKEQDPAVWNGASFVLDGSAGKISVAFENITFCSDGDAAAIMDAFWDSSSRLPSAMTMQGNVDAQLSSCVFRNYVSDEGANIRAVYDDTGAQLSLSAKNCSFLGNAVCLRGGAVLLVGSEGLSNIRFTAQDCAFTGNMSSNRPDALGGGAIYAENAALELTRCSFVSNEASHQYLPAEPEETGAEAADPEAGPEDETAAQSPESFSDYTDTTGGGAICAVRSSLLMNGCDVCLNSASLGGAFALTNSRLDFLNGIVARNHAESSVLQEGLEEGIQKGWAGGRAEGLEEGWAGGLEEGIQKGSDNRNIEIATRMLKLGYPVEQISLCTDLTEDEILALKP